MKQKKSTRGFASMSRERQREIAAMGGRAAHMYGVAHEWTTEEARKAGRKGGIISRGGRGRVAAALVACALLLWSGIASAAPVNLIGDWTQDFSTDYALNNVSQFGAGTYGFTESHPFWVDVTGSPAGPVMYVNGRVDGASTVWSKTFDAPADTQLFFSAWLGSVCCTLASGLNYPGPILSFVLNGNPLGMAATDGAGVMEQFVSNFWSGAGGSMTISLLNASTVSDGNDFAANGLSVSDTAPVPEPMSLVLLGSGLFMIVRRRLKS